MSKSVIIIPAYNEARYLGRFLGKLTQLVSKKNTIVVNDGSTDSTAKVASNSGVTTLSHMVNLGKGAAIKTGCEYAFKKLGAQAVIIMDGDDQHDPADIKGFTRELDRGADIVLGVRQLDAKMPLMRVLGNKAMSVLINLLFHHYITDIPSGFKAFTKSSYRRLKWQSAGYEVETEIAVKIAKGNLQYIEIPINTVYHGKDYGFNLLDAATVLLKLPYWLWK